MSLKAYHFHFSYHMLWFPMIVCILSCGSNADYIGLYQTLDTDSKKVSEIELKKNGEGLWRVEDNEESFTWYVKADEIRLNTKQGGVIVAKIKDSTLEIVIPGRKKMVFKKAEAIDR